MNYGPISHEVGHFIRESHLIPTLEPLCVMIIAYEGPLRNWLCMDLCRFHSISGNTPTHPTGVHLLLSWWSHWQRLVLPFAVREKFSGSLYSNNLCCFLLFAIASRKARDFEISAILGAQQWGSYRTGRCSKKWTRVSMIASDGTSEKVFWLIYIKKRISAIGRAYGPTTRWRKEGQWL